MSLSYSPNFNLQAVRDSNDRQVSLATEVTQAVGQSPSRSLSLTFPSSTLAPNLQSIQALCLNPASGICSPVGSVSATSPLYPTALHGKAYLTGSPAGLSLTLVFPAPFPLTLAGAVDLVKNSATFTGLPDIPLTALEVSLDGGPTGLFLSTCQNPTGIATAILTDQNGDKTVNAGSSFTVSGCPGTGGTPGASSASGVTVGGTTLSKGGFSASAPVIPHCASSSMSPGVHRGSAHSPSHSRMASASVLAYAAITPESRSSEQRSSRCRSLTAA